MIEFDLKSNFLTRNKILSFLKCNVLIFKKILICKAWRLQERRGIWNFIFNNNISFSSIKLLWFSILWLLNLSMQLWSHSSVIKFANLCLVITRHCSRDTHEIRWNKIRFHHVMVMSRCLQTLQITLSEVWWIIPNDMLLITLPAWYQSRLHSPRSYRKDVSVLRLIAKSAIMLWNAGYTRPVARFLRDINFPFRGNSNQFTIHAASMYA